jgi:hypothetical protein
VFCLLTAAGSLLSAEMIHRAYQNEQRRATEAEEQFQLAREAVDGMFKLCEEELADKPFLDNLRRRFLEDFLVYYQKLIEQRRDDPAAQAELSAARTRVQQILDDLAVLQGAGQYHLLNDPAVVNALDPSAEQRQQIRELTEKMRKQWWDSFREFQGADSEQRRELFLNLARMTEMDAKTVLTAKQRQRLRQIDLQRKDARAFEEPEVAAALKLTANQKEQIRTLQARAFTLGALCHPGSPAPGGPPPGRPLGRPPAGVSVVAQIEEVLTPEQRQRWRELTGEPFLAPRRPPFRPHGPGPRG